jgi:hypothetical protein
MTKVRSVLSSRVPQLKSAVILQLALFAGVAPFSFAQNTFESRVSTEAMLTFPNPSALPDSPGAVLISSSASATEKSADSAEPNKAAPGPVLLPRVKLVPANRIAPQQRAEDKIVMGLRESITPFSVIGWFASAGWSHLIDSSPNYGHNSEAFAKRLGAAAALTSSRNIFSDSILGPVFHQDTRYYQLGKESGIVHRGIYAATRPLIGKTDGGRRIPNYAFLVATAGSSGLSVTYYPEKNTSGSEVAKTFGSSLGGAAVGMLINEFGGDVIQALHLTKNK